MHIHSFWIFDKHTRCIFHRDYAYSNDNAAPVGTTNTKNDSNESKLLYGMVRSLRIMTNQLATPPKDDNEDDDDGEVKGTENTDEAGTDFTRSVQLSAHNKVHTLTTLNYSVHIHTTLSGFVFVAVTGRCGEQESVVWRHRLAAVQRSVVEDLLALNGMAMVSPTETTALAGARAAAAVDASLGLTVA
jgi:trafficking protein particle complex subunit 1